jgi:hypothetical protein
MERHILKIAIDYRGREQKGVSIDNAIEVCLKKYV